MSNPRGKISLEFLAHQKRGEQWTKHIRLQLGRDVRNGEPLLIGMFYTMTLHGQRSRDRVHVVYSRTEERAAYNSA